MLQFPLLFIYSWCKGGTRLQTLHQETMSIALLKALTCLPALLKSYTRLDKLQANTKARLMQSTSSNLYGTVRLNLLCLSTKNSVVLNVPFIGIVVPCSLTERVISYESQYCNLDTEFALSLLDYECPIFALHNVKVLL